VANHHLTGWCTMRLAASAVLLLVALGANNLYPAIAEDRSPALPGVTVQEGQRPVDPYMPVYKPRKDTSMTGRVDGGFRGGREGEPVLKVLAPYNHIGETVKKSPALYWYLSQPTSYRITFTLEDPRLVEPMLEVRLIPPTKAGIQTIRLADYDRELEPQIQYRWHLSLKVDQESPSKDIHAMGIIERIPYDQAIVEGRTACRDSRDVFCLYVESGLWYDAIQVISDLISASPRDRVLRLQRAALLDKVGLMDVAEYDRTQNGP
jgi:Domain of Unknown Function (DUF928)